jgi:class 3 adenylate cyclase
MAEPYRGSTPLATGAVTFLLTDIEGSTALWEQDGARMSQALAAHDLLARRAVESHHGVVVKMTGDGVHAVFDDARQALAATLDMQRALIDPAATCGVALRVRCGLHAGVVERRDNDYFGSTVNRAARIMSAAHGGQVLLSQAVIDGVREILPAAVSLRDLGKVRLKDLSTPEHVYQVVHPQLRQEFPALRSLEATPNNLPQQATSFIGRDQALEELQRLLVRTRLLTLTGSGGCGKTRLSLRLPPTHSSSSPTVPGSRNSRRSPTRGWCRRRWRRCWG